MTTSPAPDTTAADGGAEARLPTAPQADGRGRAARTRSWNPTGATAALVVLTAITPATLMTGRVETGGTADGDSLETSVIATPDSSVFRIERLAKGVWAAIVRPDPPPTPSPTPWSWPGTRPS